jgi:hypothetical protein
VNPAVTAPDKSIQLSAIRRRLADEPGFASSPRRRRSAFPDVEGVDERLIGSI